MLLAQKTQLIHLIANALNSIAQERGLAAGEFPIPHLERPKVIDHGDVACNIALQIAKAWKANPRELAGLIVARLRLNLEYQDLIASSDIAGPGFINFRLSQHAKSGVIQIILNDQDRFGRHDRSGLQDASIPARAMIEFVSANPTGPLHVGHGRQAALGDALANLLDSQEIKVHREFYYNDAGVQIQNLAISVQARLRGLAPISADWPKDAYNGEYINEIAQSYQSERGDENN
jgi:arginyl-tRNA synthetase